MYGPQRGFG